MFSDLVAITLQNSCYLHTGLSFANNNINTSCTVFVVEVLIVPHCTKELGAIAYQRHVGTMSRADASKTPRTGTTLLQGKPAERNMFTQFAFFAVEGIFRIVYRVNIPAQRKPSLLGHPANLCKLTY